MLVEEMTGSTINNIDPWSTTEPRHCDRGRLLRLLNCSADHRVSYRRTVDVKALRQHKWLGISRTQTIVESTGNVTLNKWISCSITVKIYTVLQTLL